MLSLIEPILAKLFPPRLAFPEYQQRIRGELPETHQCGILWVMEANEAMHPLNGIERMEFQAIFESVLIDLLHRQVLAIKTENAN